MTAEILIILACVPLYVVNSFCDKLASTKSENKYNYFYNAVKFLICSLCMLPVLLLDKASPFTSGSLLCGALCGITYAVSKTAMLKGYEKTSVAFMTLCHSSGMILPCVIGHFFWSEKLSLFSVAGILLAIISIVLLKGASQSGEKKRLDLVGALLGGVIFLTSAIVMITQKLMGIYFSGESVSAYNIYSFFVAFLILCFFVKPRLVLKAEKRERKHICLCALGSAISLSVIGFVMTSLAGAIPSVILFPLFNGSGIILVCVGSAFFFKESFTPKKAVGMAIGILGLCLVNL